MYRALVLVLIVNFTASAHARKLALPADNGSVKFAVIADSGTGDGAQQRIAERIAATHRLFPFEFVLMLGDNLYGSEDPTTMWTIRASLQTTPGRRREVLRRARQPR